MPECKHQFTLLSNPRQALAEVWPLLDEQGRKAVEGDRSVTETCRACRKWRTITFHARKPSEQDVSVSKDPWRNPR
jgi:hypothetical protein